MLTLILAICSPFRCMRSCNDSCSRANLFFWYKLLGLSAPSCCCLRSAAGSVPAFRTTSCCRACNPRKWAKCLPTDGGVVELHYVDFHEKRMHHEGKTKKSNHDSAATRRPNRDIIIYALKACPQHVHGIPYSRTDELAQKKIRSTTGAARVDDTAAW